MNLPKILALGLVAILPVTLLATAETDRKIEAAAKASYNYHIVLKDSVKVEAHDGVVTLTGSVADQDLIKLAEDTAGDLPGVLRVDNRITVTPPTPEYSDDWIALKINTRLLLTAHVSAVNTHVDVKDGIATLTGFAENVAQKELTGSYVHDIKGVKEVVNNLSVAVDPAGTRTVGDIIDDASITAQVKYALLANSATSALKTSVGTQNGVVAIEGVAANEAEKTLVTRLAGGVRGVKSVSNRMTVKE
jgi:hyperosmotically inducible periplasmic protein